MVFIAVEPSKSMPLLEFTEFYRTHLKLDGEDYQRFIESVEAPLPSVFRITQTPVATKIREKISAYPFVSQVLYLTDVYSFDLKEKNDQYREFMDFLVAQTNVGHIQRQEIVSYLPHLFLDVSKDHRVLETCASPGSKTKNLLEKITDGLLISNDKSASRANILISESTKKANPNFIITQMDAVNFPKPSILFDRICCDVPCTGDGTARKNPAIMPKWSVRNAIGLSSVQLQILKRSLELLKTNGILVYSTCSLNPIENEWVVHNALREASGYELVSSFDFVQYGTEDRLKITVREGITSFSYRGFEYENETLRKCFRILPHDQNTGGFFIAVIRKGKAATEKETTATNVLTNRFVEVDSTAMEKVRHEYGITEDKSHFISFNSNFKNIFNVSDSCFDVLCKNPKMKVVYAGIKAFTEADLGENSYRIKSAFLEYAKIPTDFTLSLDDFRKLLRNEHINSSEISGVPDGLFTCSVSSLSHCFCGFTGGGKTFLYIDKNHRKAYTQLCVD